VFVICHVLVEVFRARLSKFRSPILLKAVRPWSKHRSGACRVFSRIFLGRVGRKRRRL